MQVRRSIIPIEGLVPAVIDPNTLAAQDRPKKLDLQDMSANAPEIEEAVASCLDAQKNRYQETHKH